MNDYYSTRYSFSHRRARVWKAICEFLQRYVDAGKDRVVDLGAGYCDFINNIRASEKVAIDENPASERYCADGVTFYRSSVTDLSMLPDSSTDVVFASNLFEHLTDPELNLALKEIVRIMRNGARIILVQPNFRYCPREYFDDYTHKKAFTHISLGDLLTTYGFEAVAIYPRFMPFSFKSILPASYWLTKLYLHMPFKPMAKQMLLIFAKAGPRCGQVRE